MFSPVGQLGEEQVRRQTSSQPGEAAQDREPRQAGDGSPSGCSTRRRFGVRYQKPDGCHENEQSEEERWRKGGGRGDTGQKRGEQMGEHGCDSMEENEEEMLKSPGFNV